MYAFILHNSITNKPELIDISLNIRNLINLSLAFQYEEMGIQKYNYLCLPELRKNSYIDTNGYGVVDILEPTPETTEICKNLQNKI